MDTFRGTATGTVHPCRSLTWCSLELTDDSSVTRRTRTARRWPTPGRVAGSSDAPQLALDSSGGGMSIAESPVSGHWTSYSGSPPGSQDTSTVQARSRSAAMLPRTKRRSPIEARMMLDRCQPPLPSPMVARRDQATHRLGVGTGADEQDLLCDHRPPSVTPCMPESHLGAGGDGEPRLDSPAGRPTRSVESEESIRRPPTTHLPPPAHERPHGSPPHAVHRRSTTPHGSTRRGSDASPQSHLERNAARESRPGRVPRASVERSSWPRPYRRCSRRRRRECCHVLPQPEASGSRSRGSSRRGLGPPGAFGPIRSRTHRAGSREHATRQAAG
jgi:hypothetical protein